MSSLLHENKRLGSFLKWSWFELRAVRLCVIRCARNWRDQQSSFSTKAPPSAEAKNWSGVCGISITPLWTAQSPGEEKLVAGKVHNLRIAAAALDGIMVAPGELFSFWALIGPPWRTRGFVEGRELREGCLIASVGGGLCQLSNALHLAALEAGMTIVERHAHSRTIPGSVAATGRDATVFWNYKDLRFRSAIPFVIDATLTDTHLVVKFRSEEIPSARSHNLSAQGPALLDAATDCLQCLHRGCIHHRGERF